MKTFEAHETAWLLELDGIELADFWQRAVAFLIDAFLALVSFLLILMVIAFAMRVWYEHRGVTSFHGFNIEGKSEPEKLLTESLVPAIYFGLTTWLGKGRSPGKWLLRIRVVSLIHRHLSLWHAIERALGYAAATLEFGFGFGQFSSTRTAAPCRTVSRRRSWSRNGPSADSSFTAPRPKLSNYTAEAQTPVE